MRDRQILISPFTYTAIVGLEVDSAINEHAKATVELMISDDNVSYYRALLQKETWVNIQLTDETGKQKALFEGLVINFMLKEGYHETLLRLELISGTFLMDLKPHFRTFQDATLPYRAVHEIVSAGYEDHHFLYPADSGKAVDHLVIQHRETDWELLKRLAAEVDEVLTVHSRMKGIRYFIGLPEGKERPIEADSDVHVQIDYAEVLEKQQNGRPDITVADCQAVRFDSRELYELGDRVTYFDHRYIIYKIASRYQGAELIHSYYFKAVKGLPQLAKGLPSSAGASFEATVTAIYRDKVKVDVTNDENGNQPERKWFAYASVYSSPDGSGWYTMPEIGDRVMLYVPEREADTFVISAVHRETEGGRLNPDHKSFKNCYGKELLLTPDRLLLTNNNGMKIELSDREGIIIESDKDISILAAGDLAVTSQTASLTIAAKERVAVTQGKTTMTLSDDISFDGGQFRMQ